jgi:hypothetical protein
MNEVMFFKSERDTRGINKVRYFGAWRHNDSVLFV